MKVTIDIPESLDLAAIAGEIKLRLMMRETGTKSLSKLEELGIVTLVALEKAGFYSEKTEKFKKSRKK